LLAPFFPRPELAGPQPCLGFPAGQIKQSLPAPSAVGAWTSLPYRPSSTGPGMSHCPDVFDSPPSYLFQNRTGFLLDVDRLPGTLLLAVEPKYLLPLI